MTKLASEIIKALRARKDIWLDEAVAVPEAPEIRGVQLRRLQEISTVGADSYHPFTKREWVYIGQAFSIETDIVKSRGSAKGELTKAQRDWRDAFEAAGGWYIEARRMEDVTEVLGRKEPQPWHEFERREARVGKVSKSAVMLLDGTNSVNVRGRGAFGVLARPLTNNRRLSSVMAKKNLFQKYAESNHVSPKSMDLTGQKYEHFTVVEYVDRDGWYFNWRCKCDCGNEFVRSSKTIRSHPDGHCGSLDNHSKWRDPKKTAERFLGYFRRGSKSRCWEWAGPRNKYGYGIFQVLENGDRLAHRYSYQHFTGPIPKGAMICHHCDNPPCVNPNHLYAGNGSTNMLDRCNRARHWPFALTRDDVVIIRKRMAKGMRYGDFRDMAEEYGCDKSLLFLIRDGKIWKDVPWPKGYVVGKKKLLKGGKKNI